MRMYWLLRQWDGPLIADLMSRSQLEYDDQPFTSTAAYEHDRNSHRTADGVSFEDRVDTFDVPQSR